MKKHSFLVCALVGAAGMVGVANANTIEFRIVEQTGQTVASPLDAVLDYAVQARVTGAGLAAFGIDCIRLTGESESASTFNRLKTSELDGTYYAGSPLVNSSVGTGGLARSYSYLAGISSNFNGVINVSSGTFVNGPDNEMGLVSGAVGGAQLLGTPNVDGLGDGIPDFIPALPTPIMESYFAQDTWIDVYRFRVTVTDFTLRLVPVDIVGADGRVFNQIWLNGPDWGPNILAGPDTIFTYSGFYEVIPAPSSLALLGLGGLLAARRRRA